MASCTPTPTATLYSLATTYTPSTSYSESVSQGQVSTIVQGSCIASGTINGSSVGCISSTQITQVTTIGGGSQQVPIVVSVPVTESTPTQTLFAPCGTVGGGTQSSSTSPAPTNTVLTTSVLIQSTPPPSTVVEGTTTTLSDGSVVETSITVVTTQPPTAVYVPTTSVVSPTIQGNSSQGGGTNVAPIVGGVLGGFVGLVAIVGSLWWLCRRRRRWDDIFEKDDDVWAPSTTQRRPRGRGVDSSAEPRPYEYGLVGRVVPPVAAGETFKSSRYGSASELSGVHSRQTSLSATPLLQVSRSSRPSTSASVHTQPGPRMRSTTASIAAEPRSLSMASYSSDTGALLDGNQQTPALLGNWTPNTDDLAVLDSNHAGSPISLEERRILQIVNDSPPSPTDPVAGGARHGRTASEASQDVIIHTDGGRVAEPDVNPPAYSR